MCIRDSYNISYESYFQIMNNVYLKTTEKDEIGIYVLIKIYSFTTMNIQSSPIDPPLSNCVWDMVVPSISPRKFPIPVNNIWTLSIAAHQNETNKTSCIYDIIS